MGVQVVYAPVEQGGVSEGVSPPVIEVRDCPARDIWFLHVVLQASYQMGRVLGTLPPRPVRPPGYPKYKFRHLKYKFKHPKYKFRHSKYKFRHPKYKFQ